jgi:RNA polymerase sigma factor (sigma-70 family)
MQFQSQDKILIGRCLQNERAAQKELFERYYKGMFNVALRIVKDEELCYDVVQDAFILVFNHLHQFNYKSTIGAWIKTIVVREAIRKIKPQLQAEDSANLKYEPIEWPEAMSSEYLSKAIMELPDGYRTVFTLIEIEGYTHKDVSRMMSISEGTSKSQLYLAKKKLQKRLSGI